MPVFLGKPAPYKPSKDIEVEWDNFKGGLNTIFKPTELRPTELAEATNMMLIGEGVPTGRWGSLIFNNAGSTRIRLLDSYTVPGGAASNASTNYLLAITDDGYLVKKSGASHTMITGASFASGYSLQSSEMGNNTYIASASLPFVRFDGSNLIPYIAIKSPSLTTVSQLSAASGFSQYSWVVTTVTQSGESFGDPTLAVSRVSLPLDLTQTSLLLKWNIPSAASGLIKGFNIYRGQPGNETFIDSALPTDTQYTDDGHAGSDTIFPPDADTTGGPRAKYILKFDDRFVLAGIAGAPSKVLISGRYPYQDNFSAFYGGGYILVGPDDGDEITGLGIAGNQGMSSGGSAPPASAILVFKKNSTHRVVLGSVQIGNFFVLDPSAQLLTASNGCSSADTVVAVENDTFYFGRKGLYTVGQEPNFLNQIRTNELSARIRPYIQNLSDQDFKEATAGYMDNKYLLSFPSKKETIIYDRERGAFMGPWKTPTGITKWLRYIDADGTEKYLAGDDAGDIQHFSSSYISDNGSSIDHTLRTKKDDMGSWSVMKTLKLAYFLFRNVRGTTSVNIRLEDRTGNTVTTKSFNLTSSLGSGGWGNDQHGTVQWGSSDATVTLTGDELVRWTQLYKQARVFQIEVVTTASNSNFEFLSFRITGQSLGDNSLPASTRI